LLALLHSAWLGLLLGSVLLELALRLKVILLSVIAIILIAVLIIVLLNAPLLTSRLKKGGGKSYAS
jgi:hypothetical protein